jgi:hypothetical protein
VPFGESTASGLHWQAAKLPVKRESGLHRLVAHAFVGFHPMRKYLPLLCAITLAAPAVVSAASFEGKVNFKITSGRGQPQEMFYSIKGDKIRMEFPNEKRMGMIMDMGKKEMLMIMDEQKSYMTMAMPDSAVKAIEQSSDDVKLEKTNETEKILGYTATKYIVTNKDGKHEMWLAEGLGSFAGYTANPMGRGRGSNSQPPAWERALAGKDLFPLRVVGLGKENFRMEVTAINKQTLPDALFAPPPGYQKFDMGGMMKGMIPGAR